MRAYIRAVIGVRTAGARCRIIEPLVTRGNVHSDRVERVMRDVLHGRRQNVRRGEADAAGHESGDGRRNDPLRTSGRSPGLATPRPPEGALPDVVRKRRRTERTKPLDHMVVTVFRSTWFVLHIPLSIESRSGIRRMPAIDARRGGDVTDVSNASDTRAPRSLTG